MQWSDLSFQPSSRKLRQFAALAFFFFVGLGIWEGVFHKHLPIGIGLGIIGGLLGTIGLLRPQAIRWVYVGWMVAAFPVGWVVSRVILAVIFFGIFTPVGLLFRVLGRDAMDRELTPDSTTYWAPKRSAPDARSYYNQF